MRQSSVLAGDLVVKVKVRKALLLDTRHVQHIGLADHLLTIDACMQVRTCTHAAACAYMHAVALSCVQECVRGQTWMYASSWIAVVWVHLIEVVSLVGLDAATRHFLDCHTP